MLFTKLCLIFLLPIVIRPSLQIGKVFVNTMDITSLELSLRRRKKKTFMASFTLIICLEIYYSEHYFMLNYALVLWELQVHFRANGYVGITSPL